MGDEGRTGTGGGERRALGFSPIDNVIHIQGISGEQVSPKMSRMEAGSMRIDLQNCCQSSESAAVLAAPWPTSLNRGEAFSMAE